jgi:gamma-glutamylcyclotransferase (GGCT)/AIG2-like uncharacterized protein YtfP
LKKESRPAETGNKLSSLISTLAFKHIATLLFLTASSTFGLLQKLDNFKSTGSLTNFLFSSPILDLLGQRSNPMTTPNQNVFVYGTLMYPQVLHALLNRVPSKSKAAIHGYKRYKIKGQVFPGVIPATPECKVEGVLLKELTPEDMVVFDEFEGEEYYKLPIQPQLISEENGNEIASTTAPAPVIDASVYIWQDSLRDLLYGEWDPEAFAKTHLESYVEMCTAFAEELKEQQKERPKNRPLGFGSCQSS